MTTTLNRESFLQTLESVQPGLNVRHGDRIEQADSFVFQGGNVLTFNEELACRAKSGLDKSLSGAVHAEPLLAIVRKLTEEEIDISADNGELVLTGKRRSTGIAMDHEISKELLDVQGKLMEEIGKAKWSPLHPEFGDAINVVKQCASQDLSVFYQTCINVTPKYVEACSPNQICRWKLATGFKANYLARQTALQHVAGLGMTEFCESASWVHFRNKGGIVLSCRRYTEEFPDLGKWLRVEGEVIQLPKSLEEECERAAIFSKDNAEQNLVLVELTAGKVRIKGQGVRGWYRWSKKLEYKGKPIAFLVSPDLLAELVKRHSEAILSPDRLKIAHGNYEYVAALVVPKKEEEGKEE